jgi:hypothetical protein
MDEAPGNHDPTAIVPIAAFKGKAAEATPDAAGGYSALAPLLTVKDPPATEPAAAASTTLPPLTPPPKLPLPAPPPPPLIPPPPQKQPLPQPPAAAELSLSLRRLLDFLTLVGTAVAAEDVFRPRDATAAAAAAQLAVSRGAEPQWSENPYAGLEMQRCVV